MIQKEIPYINEIKRMNLIIKKLSNPNSITLLEFNKYKKLYANILSGVKVDGLPSPNSFKYPITSDILGSRPAIKKLPNPSMNNFQAKENLPLSNSRPPAMPKI